MNNELEYWRSMAESLRNELNECREQLDNTDHDYWWDSGYKKGLQDGENQTFELIKKHFLGE